MEAALNSLFLLYGSNEAIAEALGYTDRQYRNIKRKVRNGEPLSPRLVELINTKLQQAYVDSTVSQNCHVRF